MVEGNMEGMERTLQLKSNDQTYTNRRTLRGLGTILDRDESTPVFYSSVVRYDDQSAISDSIWGQSHSFMWRRL